MKYRTVRRGCVSKPPILRNLPRSQRNRKRHHCMADDTRSIKRIEASPRTTVCGVAFCRGLEPPSLSSATPQLRATTRNDRSGWVSLPEAAMARDMEQDEDECGSIPSIVLYCSSREAENCTHFLLQGLRLVRTGVLFIAKFCFPEG